MPQIDRYILSARGLLESLADKDGAGAEAGAGEAVGEEIGVAAGAGLSFPWAARAIAAGMTMPLVSNHASSTSFVPSFKLLTIGPLFLSLRELRFACFFWGRPDRSPQSGLVGSEVGAALGKRSSHTRESVEEIDVSRRL